MRNFFHRTLRSAAALAIAVSSISVIWLVSTASATTSGFNQLRGPVTVYELKQPGFKLEFSVDRRGHAKYSAWPLEKCRGGGHHTWRRGSGPRRMIDPNGQFREEKRWNANGVLFLRLAGRVRANRIVGEYRGFESGPERCGTWTPHGETIHFVARRVSGPPWNYAPAASR